VTHVTSVINCRHLSAANCLNEHWRTFCDLEKVFPVFPSSNLLSFLPFFISLYAFSSPISYLFPNHSSSWHYFSFLFILPLSHSLQLVFLSFFLSFLPSVLFFTLLSFFPSFFLFTGNYFFRSKDCRSINLTTDPPTSVLINGALIFTSIPPALLHDVMLNCHDSIIGDSFTTAECTSWRRFRY
jgi:hypothetical protein